MAVSGHAKLPFLGALLLLGLGWALVVLVDGYGYRVPLTPAPDDMRFGVLWFELFSEGRVIERVQWGLLGLACLTALFARFSLSATNGDPAVATTALAGGLALLLLEDSINLRHVGAYLLLQRFDDGAIGASVLRGGFELVYFGLLALMMIAPLVVFARSRVLGRATRRWLFAAYAVYAFAGLFSVSRNLGADGGLQGTFGAWLIDRLDLLSRPNWLDAKTAFSEHLSENDGANGSFGYLLVDHLVEESVELIAAGLLASAIAMMAMDLRRNRRGDGRAIRRERI